jgi:hypothetical protein
LAASRCSRSSSTHHPLPVCKFLRQSLRGAPKELAHRFGPPLLPTHKRRQADRCGHFLRQRICGRGLRPTRKLVQDSNGDRRSRPTLVPAASNRISFGNYAPIIYPLGLPLRRTPRAHDKGCAATGCASRLSEISLAARITIVLDSSNHRLWIFHRPCDQAPTAVPHRWPPCQSW